jgi:hypothetical protein
MNCCYNFIYQTYRIFFWCSRIFSSNDIEKAVFVNPSKLPWLWIGVEMKNGKIITLTEKINKYVEYGDRVDTRYLEIATNTTGEILRWLYLDAETLIEREFPAEGLIIEHDSRE